MYGYDELRDRLTDLGIETSENERPALENALKRAEQTILNTLNTERIPDELRFAALDMAAGEYLYTCEQSGSARGISSITEGDVSVSFGDKAPMESLIDELLSSGRNEIISYRRIKW